MLRHARRIPAQPELIALRKRFTRNARVGWTKETSIYEFILIHNCPIIRYVDLVAVDSAVLGGAYSERNWTVCGRNPNCVSGPPQFDPGSQLRR